MASILACLESSQRSEIEGVRLMELTDASILDPPTSLGRFQCQNAVDTGLKEPKEMLSLSYLNLTLGNEITDEGPKILNADIHPHLPQPVRLQEDHGRGAEGAQHVDIRPQTFYNFYRTTIVTFKTLTAIVVHGFGASLPSLPQPH